MCPNMRHFGDVFWIGSEYISETSSRCCMLKFSRMTPLLSRRISATNVSLRNVVSQQKVEEEVLRYRLPVLPLHWCSELFTQSTFSEKKFHAKHRFSTVTSREASFWIGISREAPFLHSTFMRGTFSELYFHAKNLLLVVVLHEGPSPNFQNR